MRLSEQVSKWKTERTVIFGVVIWNLCWMQRLVRAQCLFLAGPSNTYFFLYPVSPFCLLTSVCLSSHSVQHKGSVSFLRPPLDLDWELKKSSKPPGTIINFVLFSVDFININLSSRRGEWRRHNSASSVKHIRGWTQCSAIRDNYYNCSYWQD